MTDSAYPLPTPSTVKRLYGSAFRCAHPECSRPLYRLSDDTGDRMLNSRVAHIHARRKGGPRWLDMPAEENRAFENLVLLCTQHASEIDENPDPFPPDKLREWKAAQIAEYDRIQRSWPLSDDEATEVLVASEAFDALHAPSTVELVRRVEALRLTAERTRGGPRSWALRWQLLRQQTRSFFTAWDKDGNPVYAEPAEVEVRPMREGIISALAAALSEVEPAAEAARVELAAVRVTRAQVAPWCDALDRAIADVIDMASNWSGGPDPAADTAFDTAVSELNRTVTDLVRASRGEEVEAPEAPQAVIESVASDPFAEHKQLLDEARPFHRVDHRPYDPELRERVAEATRQAAEIAPILALFPIGLETTAALAIAVGGNANEDEQLELLERDRKRVPTCAAAALLQEASRRSDGQNAPGNAARDHLRRLWSETDWTSETAWVGNDVNGRSMMNAFARVTSAEEVRDRLARALESNPGLLDTLIISCAGWVQHHDSQTWDITGLDRVYRELPPWLPIEAIKSLANDEFADSSHDDVETLKMLLGRALGNAE